MQTNYVGPPYLPAGAPSGIQLAPAQLCPGTQILARVGDDVILTSDVAVGVEEIISRAKAGIPPEKIAEQRALMLKEVADGIEEFNAHYKDPDPVKGMSPSHRAFINQLVHRQVEIKLLYEDFRKTVPKEAWPQINETVNKHFEESQIKILMKRENVISRGDLETSLRAKGSSLLREKQIFTEQLLAQQWLQQQVTKGKEDGEEEVTHEEMQACYQAHLKDFETPPHVRWEELMISFAQHSNHDEAYAALAALGNRVLAGVPLADVARSGSEGPTAREGGKRDWTHKGNLSSDRSWIRRFSIGPWGSLAKSLNRIAVTTLYALWSGKNLARKTFLEAQKQIKASIKNDRLESRYKEYVEKLRAKYPVWTVFDNSTQQPRNPDDDDRYSRQ